MLIHMQHIYEINIKQAGKNNSHKIFNKLNEVPTLSPFISFGLTLHKRLS